MAHPTWSGLSLTQLKSSGTTIDDSSGIASVAVGNVVLAVLSMDPAAGTVTFSQQGGTATLGSWTTQEDLANGSGTSGVRVVAGWAFVTGAGSITSIRATHPTCTAKTIGIDKVLGCDGTTPVFTSASSTSAAPALTPPANDILVVSIYGLEAASAAAQTNGITGQSGFSSTTSSTQSFGTTGSGGSSNISTGYAAWYKDGASTSSVTPSASATGTAVWVGLVFQAPPAVTKSPPLDARDRRIRRNSLLRR